MMLAARHNDWTSLLLPGALLLGLAAVVAGQAGVLRVPVPAGAGVVVVAAPLTVVVPAHLHSYRAAGEYLAGGAVSDAPMVTESLGPLEIMTFEVSAGDYSRCVADGACTRAAPRRRSEGDVPVTGVSYRDATAYAEWLSAQTGETWRLPTVAEWTFAAGSKAVDPALGVETDAANPAERWLATYEKEAALGATSLATPQPLGTFGVNEYGLADLSGTVWEWTATCGSRTSLDLAGTTVSRLDSCGVRYLEGGHRAAMTVFVRDAAGGGCSSGIPPDNLGFRLVREQNPLGRLWQNVLEIVARAAGTTK